MTVASDWDARYTAGEHHSSKKPGKLLKELIAVLPKGKALDIACGEGRNAIFLAKNGYDVDAVDISAVAVKNGGNRAEREGVRVNFIQADMEQYKIQTDVYDLIVNYNYLQRTLVAGIKSGLKKGGVVIFETYTLEQQSIGQPKNPEFLLKPNELLRLFEGIHIFFYREGIFEEEIKKAVASLAGKKL